MKNGSIISGNMYIAEHFNSFFANIGPTLAKGIPKYDGRVESFLGDRVTDPIFLNSVTDDELLNIVHNAKDKNSNGYDGIDMCMLKNHSPHPNLLDLLDLKLLLVIQRRGHTTKNSTPGDAMIGDTSCLSDGKVDDCEVLRYAVQPPSSWTASWSRPADCARGEVMQFQHFTFGWHTLQVTEPAQSALRQGD